MDEVRDLYGFLHPEVTPEKEVFVSDRFKEKDGKPMPLVIRPLEQEICDKVQRTCVKSDKKGNSEFDRFKYVDEITAAAIVFPDLKNVDLQKAYGVLGEVKLLKKMLYTNEYNALVEAVQDLSGMDDDFNDLKDDVKNE